MSPLLLSICDPLSDPPGYHDPACDSYYRAFNDWYLRHPLALASYLALVILFTLPGLGAMWLTCKVDQEADSHEAGEQP